MADRVDDGQPADDGLQQERTTLAWRRTGLAVVVAAALVARLSMQSTKPVVPVVTIAGAVLALWCVASTLRRGRLAAPSTSESAFDSMLHDGKLPAVLAATGALLCLVELLVVVIGSGA
jgi:uncharacterized membrane protein YidH (DUF202 family)